MIWWILLVPIFMILLNWKEKVDFYIIRKGKKAIIGQVLKYQKVQTKQRGRLEIYHHPHVEVPNVKNRLIKLNYPNIWSPVRPFKIGEEVKVFYYGGQLFYWDSFNRGISKFLPKIWEFWKKDK